MATASPDGWPVASLATAASDPRVVYAVTYGGGVFRSEDAGVTWASPGRQAAHREYGAVSVSPADPRHVALPSTDLLVPYFERSRDGGETWERFAVGRGEDVGGVLGVSFDPTDHERLYARTWSGLFRSTDDGRT